ncbi:separin-like isoform X1 [Rhagoletis pomonella]|uniref:separin-like isoform X1 n=1 Tax=Rhagoletis pomonella TaxID=28610 RepID=UPI00177F6943|nr:separin-like isoform X1 [Rhagoletis pomonella]
MEENIVQYLLRGNVAVNAGPNAKEVFLDQVESEYNNGNFLKSIFYQVRALYQASQDRYFQIESSVCGNQQPRDKPKLAEQLLLGMNDWEKDNLKSNKLMQLALDKISIPHTNCNTEDKPQTVSCNFLQNIIDPLEGVRKIEEICQQLPKEWTILQLCKGPRTETTFSVFRQIQELDSNIYVTLLRHARSREYATPICLRFSGPEQKGLFKKYANVANQLKQCINVDPKEYNTKEAKKLYWDMLYELDQHIAQALKELKNFFFPWSFLFTGQPYTRSPTEAALLLSKQRKAFAKVDDFCNEYHWESQERVLLSLTAMKVESLSELEIHKICALLTSNGREQSSAAKLLLKLQTASAEAREDVGSDTSNGTKEPSIHHYPCILIVDERLDHFFWEELNVQQEYCRVSSLQCLWRLHTLYRERIHSGYLRVNITDGGCLLNPDNNLPKTEMRMRCFFEFWQPNWLKKVAQKPTQDELLNDFFKRSCYVYAGHGSGLQYIQGKHIARQQMNCVVFLFGCDSSRMQSNGLYSELVGSHLYYHAAKCPTLVGTLMPGLDANMDSIATEILSRWIAPHSKNVLPWQCIDRVSWQKEGVVKPSKNDMPTVADASQYQIGSLCWVLARIHQRRTEQKYYNTVPYVCRGLPVWNCDVQPLPPLPNK